MSDLDQLEPSHPEVRDALERVREALHRQDSRMPWTLRDHAREIQALGESYAAARLTRRLARAHPPVWLRSRAGQVAAHLAHLGCLPSEAEETARQATDAAAAHRAHRRPPGRRSRP